MNIVRIGLSPRAPGLTRAVAQDHWRSLHARLFAQMPGLVSYVQNHAVLDSKGRHLLADPGFDIFSEVEFADETQMDRAMESAWFRDTIEPDERRLLDASRRCFLMTHRHVLAAGAVPDVCKLVVLMAGSPGSPSKGPISARLEGPGLAPVVKNAGSLAVYDVQALGGALPRLVNLVVARGCGSVKEALDVHERLRATLGAADGPGVHAAVIVRENAVVPRPKPKGVA
jgi:hypothetical protein